MAKITTFNVEGILAPFLEGRLTSTEWAVYGGMVLPTGSYKVADGSTVQAKSVFVQGLFSIGKPSRQIRGGSSVGQLTTIQFQVTIRGDKEGRNALHAFVRDEVIPAMHFPARADRPARVVDMTLNDTIPFALPDDKDGYSLCSLVGEVIVEDTTEPT